MNMNSIEEYIKQIDRLFEENRPKEAEKLMLMAIAKAEETGDVSLKLHMLNELIGYYRQMSDKERLLEVISQAMAAAEKVKNTFGEQGKTAYATTALNAATGYRSVGELELSEEHYKIVQKIYEETLSENDMLYTGLYNNLSLLHQEQGEFEAAYEDLKKALEIVKMHDAPFETSVIYANLANTAVALKDYGKAGEYAKEAMQRFEARNTIDAHYCAALSALAMSYYYEKNYRKAYELFERGMEIVKGLFGENAQYMRLKENRDMCKNQFVTGLQLSKQYYEQYGKPMLEERFSDYMDQLAAGLVGEGSDCYGYDDALSADHDFGPDFCIWLSDEAYDEIGEEMKAAYAALPDEFMGYMRTVTDTGTGRRGVHKLSEFVRYFLGTDKYDEINWRSLEDYQLSAITNGELFYDGAGEFTGLRKKLKGGYPDEILFLKLAEDFAKIAQTGQYNYARMLKREDRLSADMMLAACIKQIMLCTHHLKQCYPPHDKWLNKSFQHIADGEIAALVKQLHACFAASDEEALRNVQDIMEETCGYIAKEAYSLDYISDVDNYLGAHRDELLRKSSYAAMSDEQLVDAIVKLEFEAFDKVKNEGGRASCQNNWPTFSIMRKSQYLTWNRTMLLQYLYDFQREYKLGHNLITEKYGRMMESTAPKRYEEIKENFPALTEEKKAVIEQIVAIQMQMLLTFAEEYPALAGNARSFHTYEDNYMNTSYETYLRGEISTYSDKMLQLYGRYVVEHFRAGNNIARMTIQNTGKLYGYPDLDEFEKKMR